MPLKSGQQGRAFFFKAQDSAVGPVTCLPSCLHLLCGDAQDQVKKSAADPGVSVLSGLKLPDTAIPCLVLEKLCFQPSGQICGQVCVQGQIPSLLNRGQEPVIQEAREIPGGEDRFLEIHGFQGGGNMGQNRAGQCRGTAAGFVAEPPVSRCSEFTAGGSRDDVL